MSVGVVYFFFFQAEGGIRDYKVTGVQTCALPISLDFLYLLNREFPRDPEVLYVSVHTYSDLSTRAAQQLATTAPNSAQAHELNAESLEIGRASCRERV